MPRDTIHGKAEEHTGLFFHISLSMVQKKTCALARCSTSLIMAIGWREGPTSGRNTLDHGRIESERERIWETETEEAAPHSAHEHMCVCSFRLTRPPRISTCLCARTCNAECSAQKPACPPSHTTLPRNLYPGKTSRLFLFTRKEKHFVRHNVSFYLFSGLAPVPYMHVHSAWSEKRLPDEVCKPDPAVGLPPFIHTTENSGGKNPI